MISNDFHVFLLWGVFDISTQSFVSPRHRRAAWQVSTSAASSRRASSDLELDGSHLRPIRVTLSPAGAAVDRHARPRRLACSPSSMCTGHMPLFVLSL